MAKKTTKKYLSILKTLSSKKYIYALNSTLKRAKVNIGLGVALRNLGYLKQSEKNKKVFSWVAEPPTVSTVKDILKYINEGGLAKTGTLIIPKQKMKSAPKHGGASSIRDYIKSLDESRAKLLDEIDNINAHVKEIESKRAVAKEILELAK